MRRLAAVLLPLALTACGDSEPTAAPTADPTRQPAADASRSPSASLSPSPLPATSRCEHAAEGYALRYPTEWSVGAGPGIDPCTFFDPQPLALEPQTEATGVAIRVDVRDVPLDQARRDTGGEQEERSANGHEAVRATGTYTDDVLLPAGTRFTTWLVDLDGRTLLLTTDTAARSDHDGNVAVLDAMAQTVEAT